LNKIIISVILVFCINIQASENKECKKLHEDQLFFAKKAKNNEEGLKEEWEMITKKYSKRFIECSKNASNENYYRKRKN